MAVQQEEIRQVRASGEPQQEPPAQGRYLVQEGSGPDQKRTEVLSTDSAIEADRAFSASVDRAIYDRQRDGAVVAHVDWVNDGSRPVRERHPDFESELAAERARDQESAQQRYAVIDRSGEVLVATDRALEADTRWTGDPKAVEVRDRGQRVASINSANEYMRTPEYEQLVFAERQQEMQQQAERLESNDLAKPGPHVAAALSEDGLDGASLTLPDDWTGRIRVVPVVEESPDVGAQEDLDVAGGRGDRPQVLELEPGDTRAPHYHQIHAERADGTYVRAFETHPGFGQADTEQFVRELEAYGRDRENESPVHRARRTGDRDYNGIPDHLERPETSEAIAAFKARFTEEIQAANDLAKREWQEPDAIEEATRYGERAVVALDEGRFQRASIALAEASALHQHYSDHRDVYGEVATAYEAQRPLELQDLVDQREMQNLELQEVTRVPSATLDEAENRMTEINERYKIPAHLKEDWYNLQRLEVRAQDADIHVGEALKAGDSDQLVKAETQRSVATRELNDFIEDKGVSLPTGDSEIEEAVSKLEREWAAKRGAETDPREATDVADRDGRYSVRNPDGYPVLVTDSASEAADSFREAGGVRYVTDRAKGDQIVAARLREPTGPRVFVDADFREAEEVERRRIEAKDVRKAAEHEAMQADPEHQAAVKEYLKEELQRTLDRRQQLAEDVAVKSDQINQVVDQLHDPKANEAEVATAYEAAAKQYAQATQAQREFEARPSRDLDVVADYRELQRIEGDLQKARANAAKARDEGDSTALRDTTEDEAWRKRERDEFLKQRGISPDTPLPETTRNEIERPLPDEKVRALMGGGAKPAKATDSEQEAQAADTAKRAAAARAASDMGRADNQVRDQSAFADARDKAKLVPPDVASHWQQDGNKYRDQDDPKKVAFVDKGNRLQTIRTFDDRAVEDMIAVADARGWTEVKVSGDEAFRRKAWIEASARGLEVKGYQPTEQDKSRAEELAKRTGRANAVEKNETLEAYRAAREGTAKDKATAAKQHPELTNAFALEAAARSFAKQRLNKDDQERFVDRTRENIERDLAQGKAIPAIRRRVEAERRQERGQER